MNKIEWITFRIENKNGKMVGILEFWQDKLKVKRIGGFIAHMAAWQSALEIMAEVMGYELTKKEE